MHKATRHHEARLGVVASEGAKIGAFQLHDQGGLGAVRHRAAETSAVLALARFSTMKLFKPSTPEQQIESLRLCVGASWQHA